MPYRNARAGEMMESTWDRHPPVPGKGRIWRREPDEDGNRDFTYPWFLWLPKFDDTNVTHGTIARTWEEAMDKVNAVWLEYWVNGLLPSTRGA